MIQDALPVKESSTVQYKIGAREDRLDISRPDVRERNLLLNAALIRRGILMPDELDHPIRFRPACFLAGPPYAGKTTMFRLFRQYYSGEQPIRRHALLHSLFDRLRQTTKLHRLVMDTTRKRRLEIGGLHRERQGDPYYYQSPDLVYKRLLADQKRYRQRLAEKKLAQHRQRYLHWAHFGGEIGKGELYCLSRYRLWQAGQDATAFVCSEGTAEPCEAQSAFYVNNVFMFCAPHWLHHDNNAWFIGPRNNPDAELDPLLVSIREGQTEQEKIYRIGYGVLVTSLVADNNGTDILFRIQENDLEGITELLLILASLYGYLTESHENRLLIDSYLDFIRRERQTIVDLAWSSELRQLSLSHIPPNFMEPLIPGYRFSSPLSGEAFERPVPRPAGATSEPSGPDSV